MKIHQHGAEIFTKTCNFEVSIGSLNPYFNCPIKRIPCYRSLMKIHQHGAEIFNKTCSFEVSVGLLNPHFNCLITRISVIEVS